MKKIVFIVLVAAIVVSFSLPAYAIHETPIDGQKYPLVGADAGKLFDFITKAKPNYTKWDLMPGSKELFSSKGPHGALVSIYANKISMDSMRDKKGMADGSILVIETYTADRKLEGCTVMYKIDGYNPEAGDWFWVKYSAPSGYVVESGKPETCIKCHSAQKENDYIFTGM